MTTATDLLERDGDVAAMRAVLADAASGDAGAVVIEGRAGIGKSGLLAAARADAEGMGMRVLAARGSEMEGDFPYGVVRQLFEAAVVGADGDRLLSGAAAAAAPIFGPPGTEPAADTSFAALHGLYWLTVNLAGDRPLLLAVDDLHWADRPSLRFLAYLVHRIEGNRLAVVTALRPSEPGTDAALMGELLHDPRTTTLRPSPLTPAATADLVEARLGRRPDAAFAAACHRGTQGNPFLLNELLRALRAEGIDPDAASAGAVDDIGPSAVSRGVLLRLSRLSPDVVDVARMLAVLGDGAELRHIAALAGLDEAAAAEATGDLVRAEIIGPDAPLGFLHPLVREAVYRDIAPGERERLHAVAARRLRDAGADPGRVAAQLLHAAPAGAAWAVAALEAAARDASQRGAPDSAVAFLRRALREPPPEADRAALIFRLAQEETNLDGAAACAHVREAHAMATDPALRAATADLLVHMSFYDDPRSGVPVAERALAELTPADADRARRIEAGRLALAFVDSGAVALDDPGFAAAAGAAHAPGVGARMLDGVAAYRGTLRGMTADDAARLALRALADGALTASAPSSIPWIAAVDTLITADRDEALEHLQAGMAVAHRAGSGFVLTGVLGFLGRCLVRRGDLEGARAPAIAAREAHAAWGGFVTVRAPAAGFLVDVLTETGDLAGADAAFAWAGVPPEPLGSNAATHMLAAPRLAFLVAAGRNEEAVAYAERCRDAFPALNPAHLPWRSLMAEALAALGRDTEAARVAEDEVAPARAWGAPRTVGRALRVLATVTRDPAVAADAVEVLEGSPARLELARALAGLGILLRLDRRPGEAREPLRRALDLAIAAGAAPLADRVRAELQAAGVRPRTDALSGAAALTASERRVAEAAAGGQTNKDIAQALYVTPKTVEVHLSNAYRKLGIRSRRELGAALAGA